MYEQGKNPGQEIGPTGFDSFWAENELWAEHYFINTPAFNGFTIEVLADLATGKIAEDIKTELSDFPRDFLEIFRDDDHIRAFLSRIGLTEIQDYIDYVSANMYRGGLIVVQTEEEIYFVVVLKYGSKYGGFEHEKIYTQEEFIKLCTEQPWETYVNGKAITEPPYALEYYAELLIPLRVLLEEMGFTVSWNSSQESITATRGENVYELYPKKRADSGGYAAYLNGGQVQAYGRCMLLDGHYYIDWAFIEYFLWPSRTNPYNIRWYDLDGNSEHKIINIILEEGSLD